MIKIYKQENYLLSIIILSIIIIIIILISLSFINNDRFEKINLIFLKISNISKVLIYFTILLPIFVIFLLQNSHNLVRENYFFEFIFHFTTFLLFGFPFLILSFLVDLLFNPDKKIKILLHILIYTLIILFIIYSIYFLKNTGYFLSIFIILIFSFIINILDNKGNILFSSFLLFIYSIYIFSFDFLRYINKLNENYYFFFLLFSFLIIFFINLANLYFINRYYKEKRKNEFLYKLNQLTFLFSKYQDKINFLTEISHFLLDYLNYQLIFIGTTDENYKKLDIIFAMENGNLLKTQQINLSNTMTYLALKSKKDYTYFIDISKIPGTMYARLNDSKINTKSYLGIPIKDKYQRNYAILGIERETSDKIKEDEIELLLLLAKNIQFILSFR